MGFFERDVESSFDRMFDFDRDGELDITEQAMQMEFIHNEFSSDTESDEEEEMIDELEMAGLDYDDLSFMDEDARNEVLEDAGLDPDDYDF